MSNNFRDDDAVGYGKPPKQHRFKPGQSGNPKGRPKQSRNRLAILAEELRTTVPVTENGGRKMMPKGNIIMRQLVNQASKGNRRAIQLLFISWGIIDENDAEGASALRRRPYPPPGALLPHSGDQGRQ